MIWGTMERKQTFTSTRWYLVTPACPLPRRFLRSRNHRHHRHPRGCVFSASYLSSTAHSPAATSPQTTSFPAKSALAKSSPADTCPPAAVASERELGGFRLGSGFWKFCRRFVLWRDCLLACLNWAGLFLRLSRRLCSRLHQRAHRADLVGREPAEDCCYRRRSHCWIRPPLSFEFRHYRFCCRSLSSCIYHANRQCRRLRFWLHHWIIEKNRRVSEYFCIDNGQNISIFRYRI